MDAVAAAARSPDGDKGIHGTKSTKSKKNEKGTLYYIAKQETLNPYAFLHTMIFQDDVALTLHRSSEAAERFVSVVYPSTIDPIEFKEYSEVAHNIEFSSR